MVTLQEAGIAAGVARLPVDLAGDPHLMQVGHWQPVVRPFMGPHLLASVAYREGGNPRPYAIERLAPTLGQHNNEVLGGLLGLSDGEIAALAAAGVIGHDATSKTGQPCRRALAHNQRPPARNMWATSVGCDFRSCGGRNSTVWHLRARNSKPSFWQGRTCGFRGLGPQSRDVRRHRRQALVRPCRQELANSAARTFKPLADIEEKPIPGRNDMRKLMMAAAILLPMLGGAAMAEDTVKIGYIDPLSGGGASVGEVGLKTFQFMADELNAKGGILGKKVEIVPLDNKTNPQESLIQAQKAIDAGVRYITQGNGSSVAGALTEFVSKYNERNPGKEVLYFNYAAVDPVLTNEKCSFWHFRWDASSDIKMEALTNYMKGQQSIKKVYLINQDYSFGESVRSTAKKMLAAKRPDIQIVGDELHPLQKVTDFSPYIAKIKASGADSVITSNWGQDFALLLKAAADAGLKVNWYTYYAGGAGGPTAIKQANLNDQVYQVSEGHPNVENADNAAFEKAFRAKFDGTTNFYPRAVNEMRMFAAAAEKAKSLDPVKVAEALEGMKFEVLDGGKGFMRKEDHQFFQPMYISKLGELKNKEPFDEEKTGWGWKTVAKIDTDQTMVPTTCKMERPN